MFDCLAAHAHRLWIRIKTLLHGFEQVLVLPSADAPLWPARTGCFERAARARRRPIAAQHFAVFLIGITIGQLLPRWTTIDILRRHIDKVLLAVSAFRLRTRGHRLRERHRYVGLLAGQNLGAVVVAAIGNGIEMLSTEHVLGLRGHLSKL